MFQSLFLFQRLWKLDVNIFELFALQRTEYYLMHKTKEIDELAVSNNLQATLRDHNYSIIIPLIFCLDMNQM